LLIFDRFVDLVRYPMSVLNRWVTVAEDKSVVL
jgi:hypothetical protein